jgi:hypothetical protein
MPEYTDSESHCYYPVLLVDEETGPRSVVAILVLQAVESQRRRPPLHLLRRVANQLLVHGDVTGRAFAEVADTFDAQTIG